MAMQTPASIAGVIVSRFRLRAHCPARVNMKLLAPLILLLALPAGATEITKPACDPDADIEALIRDAKAHWYDPPKDEIEALFVGEPYDEQTMRNTITKSVQLCKKKHREYEAFVAGRLPNP